MFIFRIDKTNLGISLKDGESKFFAVGLSQEVIQMTPVISKSINFKEGNKGFEYKGEIFIDLDSNDNFRFVKLYFGWKKNLINRIEFIPDPQLTSIDWKNAMFFAVNMADFDFFDVKIGPKFPSIDFMSYEIFNLPNEGVNKYELCLTELLKKYLEDIFLHKASWKTEQQQIEALENLIDTIEKWWEHQQYSDSHYENEHLPSALGPFYSPPKIKTSEYLVRKYEAVVKYTLMNYNNKLDEVKGKSYIEKVQETINKFHGKCTPIMLIKLKLDEEINNSLNRDYYNYDTQLRIWGNYSESLRRQLAYAFFDCYVDKMGGGNFYEDWLNFFTINPFYAEYIWKSIDREELLNITNVPTRKRNAMLKATFAEAREYVNSLGPNIELIKIPLKKNQKRTKK